MTMDQIKQGRQLVDSVTSSVWRGAKGITPHVSVVIVATEENAAVSMICEEGPKNGMIFVEIGNRGQWLPPEEIREQ